MKQTSFKQGIAHISSLPHTMFTYGERTKEQDRTVFLIDMNAYFASVEQIANPRLRGKPIVVCGKGRTVVTTASYEARAFGVKTGMNLYEAKKLCPQVIPVCGNLDKYIDTSHRLHRLFLEFTDQVEAFSIDECFLDVTHRVRRGENPAAIARQIKMRMKQEFGLLCSIGIGPNKLIAKLASKMQKPDGLVAIPKEDVPRIFAGLPVEQMQGVGIGRKLSRVLKAYGMHTAKDLGEASISMLTARFGVLGYHLQKMGRGEDDAMVKKYWEEENVKSVGHSYTLPRDTSDMRVITAYLRMLSEKVGVRLREYTFMGKTICLTVRYADFDTITRHHSLQEYIKSGGDIYAAACAMFKKLLPFAKAVRLLGVSIGSLVKDDKQMYLLDDMKRQNKLLETVDAINTRFGDATLKPLSVMRAEKFRG